MGNSQVSGSSPGNFALLSQTGWQDCSTSLPQATDQASGTTTAQHARNPGSIPHRDIPQTPNPTPNPTLPFAGGSLTAPTGCGALWYIAPWAIHRSQVRVRAILHFYPKHGWQDLFFGGLFGIISLTAQVLAPMVATVTGGELQHSTWQYGRYTDAPRWGSGCPLEAQTRGTLVGLTTRRVLTSRAIAFLSGRGPGMELRRRGVPSVAPWSPCPGITTGTGGQPSAF